MDPAIDFPDARPRPAYPDPATARVCIFIDREGKPVVLFDGVDRTRELSALTVSLGVNMLPQVNATFVYSSTGKT